MSRGQAEPSRLILVGASEPAAREFLSTAHESGFPGEVAAIASANPDVIGRLAGETALAGIPGYDDRRIISLTDAFEVEAPVVVSFLTDEAAKYYEDSLAKDRLLITGSHTHSMRSDVALANPYTNPGQVGELFEEDEDRDRNGRIIAIGESGSIGAAVALAPLHQNWGVVSVDIETLQGWRDTGISEVPQDKQGRIVDINKDKQLPGIEHEPQRLLSPSIREPAGIIIDATPKHGPWVGGYHAVITARLASSATAKDVEKAWEDWRAPKALKGMEYGANSPERWPLEVSKKSKKGFLQWDGSIPEIAKKTRPMRVRIHLRKVDDEGRTITFEVLGDDMALGNAGSMAMTLAYAKQAGYLD